jgi:hypothetical protein
VRAQNLEAGKSPSQIFAGTCAACHKSSRGLLKTVAPGSLPAYLRQHYTTSSDMAGLLSAYLISNGATDTRYGVAPAKPGHEIKPEPTVAAEPVDPRLGRKPRPGAPQEAAKPDADGLAPPDAAAAARAARSAKRLPKPVPENPDAAVPAVEGQPAAETKDEPPPLGVAGVKQRVGKKGRPGQAPPKTDAAKVEPAKDEPRKDDAKGDIKVAPAAPAESAKSEPVETPKVEPKVEPKPEPRPDVAKSEPAPKDDTPKAITPLRADPVPAVTPAPKAAETESAPPQPAPAPAASATPPAAPSPPPAPPAVTASAPPPPPAGPPAPPISQ